MLLYTPLHLVDVKAVDPRYDVLGYPLVMLDDMRRFRQIASKCPGHPARSSFGAALLRACHAKEAS